MVSMLHQLNIRWNENDTDSCDMLKSSIDAWTAMMVHKDGDVYHSDLVRATLSPVRCEFQNQSDLVTNCYDFGQHYCQGWKTTQNATTIANIATLLGLRLSDLKNVTISVAVNSMTSGNIEYRTEAIFDVSVSIQYA